MLVEMTNAFVIIRENLQTKIFTLNAGGFGCETLSVQVWQKSHIMYGTCR